MAQLKLNWFAFANQYEIYRSGTPGEEYVKIDSVFSDPEGDIETYMFNKNIAITGLLGYGSNHSITLNWDKTTWGSPETYKIIEAGSEAPHKDTLWMSNYLPYGSYFTVPDGSSWSSFCRSGTASLKVEAPSGGYVYPQFIGAMYPISSRFIIIWMYIDPENIPDSILLSFFDGNWDQRVYWGDDLIPYGVEGKKSKLHMGSIPNAGSWTPLIVDKMLLNCRDITGMGIATYKKQNDEGRPGVVYIDAIVSTNDYVYSATPSLSLSFFKVHRKREDESSFKFIGESKKSSFVDENAIDIYGYGAKDYVPQYEFLPSPSGQEMTISWTVPIGTGTEYTYRVSAVDGSGEEYEASEVSVSSFANHGKVVIYGGDSWETLSLIGEEEGNKIIHENLNPETLYFYQLEAYNPEGEMTSLIKTTARTKSGSNLGSFVLDSSILA